jgi:DNA-binding MarR family transcriptional regulator
MASAPGGQVPRHRPAECAGLVPAPKLAAQLRRAFVLLRRQIRRKAPSELTVSQLSVLATVVRSGPLGVGQLAEAEVLPSPAATRLADKLEETGLICRRPNPEDRRGVLLVATAAGRELLARREQASNAWLAERLAALPKSDRLALQRAAQVLESLAGAKGTDEEVQT